MGLFTRTPKPRTPSRKLSEVLRERGYIYQHSSALEEITDGPQRTVYEGFDPSADSLHVGNLVGILVLRRFLEAGHKVILVVGGGTGMIGDPSGKSEERVLLTPEQIAHNSKRIADQAKTLLGSGDFRMVNNADWLTGLNLLDFLRDIGKSFSVNAMIQRDSVKERLENREQGISYTEFSYMLLQAYDFLHLHERYGCDWQHGSSDQWGNIVSGVDLIRRRTGKTVYGTTHGLLINKATGKKFGKTEGGAVWLDPHKTNPFDFYQFWFNTADDDVEEYLLKMTLVPKKEIDEIMQAQRKEPSARAAQKKLAFEVTALVHGKEKAENIKEEVPTVSITKGTPLREALKDIVASTSELRRLVEGNAIAEVGAHGQRFDDIHTPIERTMVVHIGKYRLVKIIVK